MVHLRLCLGGGSDGSLEALPGPWEPMAECGHFTGQRRERFVVVR